MIQGSRLLLELLWREWMGASRQLTRSGVLVRFITDGGWSHETMKQVSHDGFSVWRMNTLRPGPLLRGKADIPADNLNSREVGHLLLAAAGMTRDKTSDRIAIY